MTAEALAVQRAEVIRDFIGVEALVDCVISIHYLGRLSLAFYHEVLYDEYFSFGLKVRILNKMLSEEGKEANDQIQILRRLNNIRNFLAHCGVTRYKSKTDESYVPNPRDPEKALDFDALHAEFTAALPTVRGYLLAKAVEKGADIKTNKDGTWEQVLPSKGNQ